MNKVEEQLRMMPGIIDVHVPPHTYENMHAYMYIPHTQTQSPLSYVLSFI